MRVLRVKGGTIHNYTKTTGTYPEQTLQAKVINNTLAIFPDSQPDDFKNL